MMPRSILAALALLLFAATAWTQEQRYEAWTVDGTRFTGAKVAGNHEPAGAPMLDGRTLLTNDGGSTRALYDRTLSGELSGPYVQFTNGDLLPGKIVSPKQAGGRAMMPGQVIVHIDQTGRDGDFQSSLVSVRESALWRIGVAKSDTYLSPGQISLADGRLYTARAIRCEADGLECLTADGVQFIGYDQIRGIHFPKRDPIRDLLQQNAFAGPGNRATLMRLRMATGGVLTVPRGMAKRVSDRRIMVRPAWALESFAIHRERIAWHTWWRHNEVPLSLLPAELHRASQGLHGWPARFNANVMGGPLRAGAGDTESAADLGLGTHAGTRAVFTLPPASQKFHAWVGIDRTAGQGGCAIVKVYRDEVKGDPTWQSGFLRGGEAPVRIGPLDLGGAKKLILVTDWAHLGRPAGADPLDIRDYVDWIHPFVEIDANTLPLASAALEDWIPELAGWQLPEKFHKRVDLRPTWAQEKWRVALAIDSAGTVDPNVEPVELTRQERVTVGNGRLILGFGHDGVDSQHYHAVLLADGKELESTVNGRPNSGARPGVQGDFDTREYNLPLGSTKPTSLVLRLDRVNKTADRGSGLLWRQVEMLPLIEGMSPSSLEALRPNVLLTSLTPISAPADFKPQPGMTAKKPEPLAIRGYPLSQGFSVLGGTSLTYKLEPNYTRFVAIVGLAQGRREVGPYTILLDDKPHWKLDRMFGINSPGVQIEVPIPPGHKTITLQVGGAPDCELAWGNAGFVTE